jgi:16S rRNA processing protein RimM
MRSKSSTTEVELPLAPGGGSPPAGPPSSSQPREDPPTGRPESVLVGTILRPHGIKGEVAVALWSDNERRFAPGVELAATPPGARSGPPRPPRVLRIERATPHKGGLRIAFAGFADREGAETLRGLDLWVPISEVPAAPAGSYYFFELIGCRCFDHRTGEPVEIGTVVDLHQDGGGTLLEVEQGGRRSVVPFVEAFLVRVDREARRIDLSLPEGLLATCAFKS